jgi:hypothetical protein
MFIRYIYSSHKSPLFKELLSIRKKGDSTEKLYFEVLFELYKKTREEREKEKLDIIKERTYRSRSNFTINNTASVKK